MTIKKIKSQSTNIRFAALAVDVVCFRIFEGKLQVLLGEVSHDIFKDKLAHIGGLVRINETAEQAVDRLLKDKAGISGIYKEQLYTFSDIDRDPRGRVVSVAYIAFVSDPLIKLGGSVATDWFDIKNVPQLGYDHSKILSTAIERLKSRIVYTDIAKHLIDKEFTLSELQAVYQAVLGRVDKRNFRKRMLTLNILKDIKKKAKRGVMRPAALYRFK